MIFLKYTAFNQFKQTINVAPDEKEIGGEIEGIEYN